MGSTASAAQSILDALGLEPISLQAVQEEGTEVLPGLRFAHRKRFAPIR